MANSNLGVPAGGKGLPRTGSPGRGFASMDPERQSEAAPHEAVHPPLGGRSPQGEREGSRSSLRRRPPAPGGTDASEGGSSR